MTEPTHLKYLDYLALVHQTLRPRLYLEIGSWHGNSLTLARCPTIAVEPKPLLTQAMEHPVRLFRQTSDDFFARPDIGDILSPPPDLAFIDGMHLAEFALRDFINVEKHAAPGTVVLLDDVLPDDIAWASRTRGTGPWTGDIYKLVRILRDERPDLEVAVFDVEFKGLAVISNLDPSNDQLAQAYGRIARGIEGETYTADTVEELHSHLRPQPRQGLKRYLQDRKPGEARAEAGADRAGLETDHLELVKKSILNEIYLDNELRLYYLRECLAGRESFDAATYHDIRRARSDSFRRLRATRQIGAFFRQDIENVGFSHAMMGRKRLDSLHDCLDHVRREGIPGDLAECGVWRGGGCIFMAAYLRTHRMRARKVIVADSFQGLPVPSHSRDADLDLSRDKYPQLAVSLDTVRDNFAAYDLLDETVEFVPGWFRDTLPGIASRQLAVLRLDGDLYESTRDALEALYDRVAPGGVVIADDYSAVKGCREAIEDFFAARGEPVPALTKIDWAGAWWIKP